MGKVLILTDGKAGHENQSKALARSLGCDFDVHEIHFKSRPHKAASYVFDRFGFRTTSLFSPLPSFPSAYSAVIGTGSGTFYAAKSLAKKLGVRCGVVLYPRGYDIASFDCIMAPSFDRPAKARNVIEIPTNLVASDAAFYAKGVSEYRAQTGVEPEIAVIIGGPNKCSTMTVDWMRARLDEIFKLSGKKAVTTSRRTPAAVEALVDSYPWDYKLIYSKNHFNPIPAFVNLAKRLYVTAESTGMLSEACMFGTAEVVALDNLKPGPHKFRRFVADLRDGGYVDGNKKVDLKAQFSHARKLLGL